MGEIGDLDEPMLNFTLELINSRVHTINSPEAIGLIGDNFNFEYLLLKLRQQTLFGAQAGYFNIFSSRASDPVGRADYHS